MDVIEESVNNVVSVFSPEIASQVTSMMTILKTIGGLFIIYLGFYIVRFYFIRKQTKAFKEMKEDIKLIKKSLKIKKK